MSSATASLEAALRYAELGYRVLPLKPNGKTPACEHGHKDATTDPETIRSWWEAHPERGVAVATGGKSGLTVVDLDTAEGHGSEKDGEASLAEWCKENDVELPETVACRTPSGGLHLYFSAPGRNLRNRTSVLPGVDVRGEGGYVVAPSTALPGGVYEWVGGSSPENVEPAPMPEALARLVADNKAERHGKGKAHFTLPDIIAEGERHDTLMRHACSLQEGGKADRDILRLVSEANRERCKPPLPEGEVEELVADIVERYPKGGAKRRKKATVKQIASAIEGDERFGGIRYDKSACRIVASSPMPWGGSGCPRPWGDHDDAALYAELQGTFPSLRREDVRDALSLVAHCREYSPAVEMLESLPGWDGTPRVKYLACWYLGARDNEYTHTVMHLLMASLAMRAYRPGCQCDHVVVLQGPQGIGKSTFLRTLALDDSLFTDAVANLSDPKAVAEVTTGKLVVELSELSAISKARDVEAVKAAITRRRDEWRPAYGRNVVCRERSFAFVGTTNDPAFLSDPTGNRRFVPLPVGVGKPDRSLWDPSCRFDFEQAWAETLFLMEEAGGSLPTVLPLAAEAAACSVRERYEVERPYEGLILEWAKAKAEARQRRVCTAMVLKELPELEGMLPKVPWKAIAAALDKAPGWRRLEGKQKVEGYGSQKAWEYGKER